MVHRIESPLEGGQGIMLYRVGDSKNRFWASSGQSHDWYVGRERSEIIRLCETGLGGSGDRWSGCIDPRRGVGGSIAPCQGSTFLLFPIGMVTRHNIS